MATIKDYDTANGRRYMVRYSKPDGTETKKRGFPTKAAATAWAHKIETDKNSGFYVDPQRGKITVSDWAETWLAGKANLAASTRHRYRGIIDTWIAKSPLGGQQIGKVRHVDVQEWVTAQDCASASTVKHHRVLSQILELAVRDGRIPSNPAHGVNLPPVTHKKRRYLTASEVEAFATAAGPVWRPLILFLAYTGLRWGEMAALQVSDVDLLRRRVYVARSVTVVDGRFVWGEPKSRETRWVPIPKSVADELAKYLIGRSRDGLVFSGEREGNVLRVKTARESWFDEAVKEAGLPEKFTPHELRHTAASLAISAGASVLGVQRMLGHAKASMTLDVYSDLFDDDLDAVAAALDKIRSEAV